MCSGNIPRNFTTVTVRVLKQGVPSSMECIMCTSRAGIMVNVVNVVNCSSCKKTTFELRRTDSFLPLVVTTYKSCYLAQLRCPSHGHMKHSALARAEYPQVCVFEFSCVPSHPGK